jgi:uncharacterized protein (DUF2252 family)
MIDIRKATSRYEAWLAQQLTLLRPDLELKHQRMRQGVFPFLRATYYRWAQLFPEVCPEISAAPMVLAVGDLHVENFGTWRDAEGRLVWGVNDFDEAWRLPYTNDLTRLATSACLAVRAGDLVLSAKEVAGSLLDGYTSALEAGGRPFVLAEHHAALRTMAVFRLHDAEPYWKKLEDLPTLRRPIPKQVAGLLVKSLPKPGLPRRVVHRVAGVGSLGRERYLAIADWGGGKVAREAKASAPSACAWAEGLSRAKILYSEVLDRSVRCPDPFLTVKLPWIVRRLAPDCSRIELSALPKTRDEARLLHAMGWETANIHLGSAAVPGLRADLGKRPRTWLAEAGQRMADAVERDWKDWQ